MSLLNQVNIHYNLIMAPFSKIREEIEQIFSEIKVYSINVSTLTFYARTNNANLDIKKTEEIFKKTWPHLSLQIII